MAAGHSPTDLDRISLRQASDTAVVLLGTMRGVSLDDFEKAITGKSSSGRLRPDLTEEEKREAAIENTNSLRHMAMSGMISMPDSLRARIMNAGLPSG